MNHRLLLNSVSVVGGDLELQGTPDALRELASCLRSAGSLETCIDANAIGEGAPQRVCVRVTKGMVRIYRLAAVLCIGGSPERLEILAGNVDTIASSGPGNHIHVEHYEGHPYLGSTSEPLVIACTGSSGAAGPARRPGAGGC